MKRLWKGFVAASLLAQLGQLAFGALLLFHAWLLARRLSDGALLDSTVLWRWLGAGGLLLFWQLQRHLTVQLSVRARKRSHLAFWLLVLVLHSGVPAADPAFSAIPLTELSNLALPLLAALLLFETVAALSASRKLSPRFAPSRGATRRRALQAGFLPQLSCRPPPQLR